ncbi:MAG: PQQ-dependent sugar dehydrogenase [Acidobacteria bacterium]|nr:PQQ-dependent sugar dehydrogenase [Acidobacteriota bacterium]
MTMTRMADNRSMPRVRQRRRAVTLAAGLAVCAFAVSHGRQGDFDGPIGRAPGASRFIEAASSLAPGAVPDDVGHLTFMSPHASPIAVAGGSVFVANTPADTVDVIEDASRTVTARIRVGIDPVGLAVRPDGKEVWVANHVSDSVSVIDADPDSLTYLQVIATVQDIGTFSGATRFDEPVGIAFASDEKAYVALSSENQVAIVDVAARRVTRYIDIRAQDPRALAVRGERLYVIPFESHNRTQISGCRGEIDGELCTFDAQEHVVDNNNVLSLGITVDVVKHPDVPDRDLYVFDTTTDALVEVVDSVGTLLYGLAVDSGGEVFVAQADARNDANGRAGTEGEGLAELENRAFLNRITRIDCGGGSCGDPEFIELEPLPPAHPEAGQALATPFAIAISDDDATLVVSAAGSDKLFTVDAASGEVLGRTAVDAVPRGIALESDADGAPSRAWVLNAVANTVSLVDVSTPASPGVVATVILADPTPAIIKRGRIAFHDADASSTGTFSCESCHPDGHTDQLVWVLDTPICDRDGCTQIPPRSTMPVRGLRDTAPYHWDGIPGDPYGGVNTASTRRDVEANCDADDPRSCTRQLVDSTLGSTMCAVGECGVNDEGQAGALSGAERDDLAEFLLNVPYPPSRRRSFTNELSDDAVDGFEAFHVDGVPDGDPPAVNVCGNCHRMPFWTSTNTGGTGMDAPTWRGAYDRWLILPQGRWNVIDLRGEWERNAGFPERSMWGASLPARRHFWDMVQEGSTGFSGAFARQVTLNPSSPAHALTAKLLEALELGDREGAVVLQGEGVFIDGDQATPVALEFDGSTYVERSADRLRSFSRTELISRATGGTFVGTFTGRLGPRTGPDHPQPALWTPGPMHEQRGRQIFQVLTEEDRTMMVSGRHIEAGARLFVDGRRVTGSVRCRSGELPDCEREILFVQLPQSPGMHFLQVQNPGGLFSNDLIFYGRPLHGAQLTGGAGAGGAGVSSPAAGMGFGGAAAAAGLGDAGLPSAPNQEPADPVREPRVAAASPDGIVITAADGMQFGIETVATGLVAPGSLAFAPDGRLFLAEGPGRVRILSNTGLLPQPAFALTGASATGWPVISGLALDPEFASNGYIYLLQTDDRYGGAPAARLVRYRAGGNALVATGTLLDGLPPASLHGGGRLRFGPDNLLYVTVGDAHDSDAAQDLAAYGGKILRLRPDGTTPRDNPFLSPVYSWGHRDPRALDWHPLTGALWLAEPGGAGAGELNRIGVGANYGWPIATDPGGFDPLPGMRAPLLSLSPPATPSGAAFYSGTAIPGFRNDLFLATLDGAHLLRIRFDPADPSRIVATERMLDGPLGRLSDVVAGPDGALYVATGNRDGIGEPIPGDDRIVRLAPVD